MEKLTVEQVTPVVKILMNSNTPMYLLRRMKEDQMIQEFARSTSAEEIGGLIKGALQNITCVEHLAETYAFIAALSLKTISEIADILENLDLSSIAWGDYLKRAITQEGISTRIVEFNCSTKLPDPVRERSMISTSATIRSKLTLQNLES